MANAKRLDDLSEDERHVLKAAAIVAKGLRGTLEDVKYDLVGPRDADTDYSRIDLGFPVWVAGLVDKKLLELPEGSRPEDLTSSFTVTQAGADLIKELL